MGMTNMFSNAADFSDLLTQNEALKVSKVVHKAFIEVNEEGAEAAAATGMFFLIFPLLFALVSVSCFFGIFASFVLTVLLFTFPFRSDHKPTNS